VIWPGGYLGYTWNEGVVGDGEMRKGGEGWDKGYGWEQKGKGTKN
jgi:hypothetical protein